MILRLCYEKTLSNADLVEWQHPFYVIWCLTRFIFLSLGMVTFHYDAKTDQFTNRAFNFYVWPRPFSRSAPDPRFGCQTSSIDFLVSQNFDFNKLFRDGISYLRPSDENRIRDRIKDNQQNRKNNMTPGAVFEQFFRHYWF